ncbi:MAG: tripartite tricarboxylate transporter TctB family protein [Fusobacteriaceae bacterium]|jgi:hypothetical protein|nr:tripartite tricarboxylate transporter TctB family protein [Fusobacteriaceae bacterium]
MDILFSGALLIFSVYCFILVGSTSPAPTQTELGAAFWPRIILFFLIALTIVNLVNIFKNAKQEKKETKELFADLNLKVFVKSKLFVGMILVAAMALLYSKIGFIPVSFLFLFSYGMLIGAKQKWKLALFSLLITAIIYVLFQGALKIMLARGIGPFRSFALFLESLLMF